MVSVESTQEGLAPVLGGLGSPLLAHPAPASRYAGARVATPARDQAKPYATGRTPLGAVSSRISATMPHAISE